LVQSPAGKFAAAPAGTYTAKNGAVYNVAVGGQVSVNGQGGPAREAVSLQAGGAVVEVPYAVPARSPGGGEKEFVNIPASLKGLTIFRSGTASQNFLSARHGTVSAKMQTVPGLAGTANAGNPPPTQPDQGAIVITPSNLYTNPNWCIAGGSGVDFLTGSASGPLEMELWDSNTPSSYPLLLYPVHPNNGTYYLIDLLISATQGPELSAGGPEFIVTGPDGTQQTFAKLKTPGLSFFRVAITGADGHFWSASITPLTQ
jgi:hypothetical protein